MNILAVDPGTKESGYVFWEKGVVAQCGVIPNDSLIQMIQLSTCTDPTTLLALEMIDAMGMEVGKEVFETVRWTGRFQDRCIAFGGREPLLVYRKDIKMHLCGSMRAKDKNIRQALIDRLGMQGTKKNPGPTYGVSSHAWAALAVAVYVQDLLGA